MFKQKQLEQSQNNSENLGDGLIFIIGMPRSGTSLVEQILSSHPEVFGAGELPFLEKEVRKIFLKFKEDNYLDKDKIHNLIVDCKNKYLEKISNYETPKIIIFHSTINSLFYALTYRRKQYVNN